MLMSIRKHLPVSKSLSQLAQEGRFAKVRHRKQSEQFMLEPFEEELLELLEKGDVEGFLTQAVKTKRNIAVAGPTGSGKTTLTRSLMGAVPTIERVLLMEDTHEIDDNRLDEVGYLMYGEGDGRMSARECLKLCMRLSPDRIFLTELRDDAAWDYLAGANTGHPGGIFSTHADSAASTPNSLLPAAPRDSLLVLQDIAPGTPSTLIERRPDILASEHRLKARNADIGAARAAFFPRLSLTGSVGSSSTELSGLFDGGSRAWSFAPSLSLPIFAGGRNRANLDLAEVRKDAAVAAYEGTIQVAFREVADALTATDTLRREEAARRALADSSVAAMTLAKARYDGGVDDYLRYLDAQRSTFGNQVTLIQISTERQIALVDLFKSLGGGWEESPAGVQP